MPSWAYISLIAVVVMAGLIRTGWWRYGFILCAIRPASMTVRRLGLNVFDTEDITRVDSVLRHFLGGFNAMVTKPSRSACSACCEAMPVLYRPFAEEGVAMGYTLRRLFRYTPEGFERDVVKVRPEYRYLYYVGLGFWSGMRNHDARKLDRIVDGLDPLHRYLVFDGYGFKRAFFDYPKDRDALRTLDDLSGYGRNAAYQGVGRALWFWHMGDMPTLIEKIESFGDCAADVAAGVGLASVFVNPDRLPYAQAVAMRMPDPLRPHFHLGMCFALKARSINDLAEFQRQVSTLEPSVQDAVWACIRECDRVELQVRSDQREDPYRRWRGAVTAWMEEHVEFPVAGLKSIGSVGGASGAIQSQTEVGG